MIDRSGTGSKHKHFYSLIMLIYEPAEINNQKSVSSSSVLPIDLVTSDDYYQTSDSSNSCFLFPAAGCEVAVRPSGTS